MTPFEEATDFAQTEHIPLAGYGLPCIRGLRHHLQNMVSKYHSGFVRALKASFERRMPEYEQNKTYIHAAILDPRFKLRWCEDDKERKELEKELNDKATRLMLQQQILTWYVSSRASSSKETETETERVVQFHVRQNRVRCKLYTIFKHRDV